MYDVITSGVTIGGKHSYNDYGLVIESKEISAPATQTKYVTVPGRNSQIDLSEVLTGNPRYKDRTITVTFNKYVDRREIPALRSSLLNEWHGKRLKIVFDDDPAFYWLGRISLNVSSSGNAATVTLEASVEPYKYNITTSAEDWLWDPFDFEESYINETANMVVNGSLTYKLICSARWENPIIVSNAAMTLTVDGTSYNIVAGSQVLYELILTAGEHTFVFTGNGTVTINYVGGML